jgi:hypothetical protein
MRISIDPQDRAFGRTPAGLKAVTVDGVHYPMVITADEEEGYVLAYRQPLQVDPKSAGPDMRYLTIEVRGKVVLEWDQRRWDKDRRATTATYGEVKVGRDADGSLVVRVMSAVRPGAGRQLRLPAASVPSSRMQLVQKAGAMAGAAAEDMCERFGDTLDPSECAKAAIDAACRMLEGEAQDLSVGGAPDVG